MKLSRGVVQAAIGVTLGLAGLAAIGSAYVARGRVGAISLPYLPDPIVSAKAGSFVFANVPCINLSNSEVRVEVEPSACDCVEFEKVTSIPPRSMRFLKIPFDFRGLSTSRHQSAMRMLVHTKHGIEQVSVKVSVEVES